LGGGSAACSEANLKELLIGCGNQRKKILSFNTREFVDLTTLDFDPLCNPDVLHDLEVMPYPFEDNSFDEIHAYEVLEHTGKQGDWKFFFDQFGEFHRILKPDGILCASVPAFTSVWAWGDPSHTRVLNHGSLVFLSQQQYKDQVGKTAMSDFRRYWTRDFKTVHAEYKNETFYFALQAIK
jgi:predicted SAM-dependent methyltransferase